ncbi:UNVERIFIED_CONTAM: hypothetical protein PYX00_009229 [Menopon gallinae]|uniref:Organic solute transporter alpha-like protein n=1 Tax=Menopon gallinae TaxID=328185 RepID=A0AAW2HAI0_9NEOP
MENVEWVVHNITKLSRTNMEIVWTVNDTEDTGNVQNLAVFCKADYLPSVEEYFTAFNIAGVVLFSFGAIATILTLLAFGDTIRYIIKNAPSPVKTHSAFVLSVYPVVSISIYCAVIVPRAQLLAEAVTQGMFMASLYQLFCLMVAYCGGEAELIMNAKPKSLKMKVPPCCCYPCCLLPTLTVTKKHVKLLRLSVLQLPVVQGLIYMVFLVMWADEESLYHVNYMYFQPVVVASILIGIWGVIMTMKMLAEMLKDYHLQGKFIVLQLVLLLAKLQGLIARIVVWTGSVKCKPPITATVYSNLVYNSMMLAEMVILGFIARHLYKRRLPGLNLNEQKLKNQICVVSNIYGECQQHEQKEAGVLHPTFHNVNEDNKRI